MFIRQSSVPQNRIFRDQDENSCSPGSGHSEIDQLVQHLRVVKDDHEVKLLQEASDVAAAAFNEAIGYSKVGMCENELAAKFQFSCIRDGADMLAYTPVVASGSQALVIHYIQNRHLLRTDELVLMDAGAYYHGYNTDVTRTWSPGRNYSEPQLELYLVMLELQKDCIRRCVSNGVESLDTLHSYCVDELVLRLNQKLKFNVDKECVERVLFPHSIGHYLGMDLHDCQAVSTAIPFVTNMVITVEPGIYVPVGDSRFPERFQGIGIRIEDDIVIKPNHPIVLSREVSKEPLV